MTQTPRACRRRRAVCCLVARAHQSLRLQTWRTGGTGASAHLQVSPNTTPSAARDAAAPWVAVWSDHCRPEMKLTTALAGATQAPLTCTPSPVLRVKHAHGSAETTGCMEHAHVRHTSLCVQLGEAEKRRECESASRGTVSSGTPPRPPRLRVRSGAGVYYCRRIAVHRRPSRPGRSASAGRHCQGCVLGSRT